MRCDECMFWEMTDNNASHIDDFIGKCHRYPPVIDPAYTTRLSDDEGSHSDLNCWEQPHTDGVGWCGEFKGKPNKNPEKHKQGSGHEPQTTKI